MVHPTELNIQQLIALQQHVAAFSMRSKHIHSPMGGAHLSRLRGRGMEIDEVRVYQSGDEVGSIDWKVTARTGTTHTKVFREERERPVLMCLDYRANMFFATQGVFKSVLATQAAALLAWHGVAKGDRLGGLLFADAAHHEIKPARGKRGVLQFLHGCCQADVWQQKHPQHHNPLAFEETLRRLRCVVKPGSLVYLLSDFRGLNDVAVGEISQLARHNDVVLIEVSDALERSFTHRGTYPIFDGLHHFTCDMNRDVQRKLRLEYEARLALLQALQQQHGVFHIALSTEDDVTTKIHQYLWT